MDPVLIHRRPDPPDPANPFRTFAAGACGALLALVMSGTAAGATAQARRRRFACATSTATRSTSVICAATRVDPAGDTVPVVRRFLAVRRARR